MLKIVTVEASAGDLVRMNQGYCPCAVVHNEDTKCPCKEFREQQEPGLCHCGRYGKVEVEDV